MKFVLIILFFPFILYGQWQKYSVYGDTTLHQIGTFVFSQVTDSNDVYIYMDNIGKGIDSVEVYHSLSDTVDARGEGTKVDGDKAGDWVNNGYETTFLHENIISAVDTHYYYIWARFKSGRWLSTVIDEDSVVSTVANVDASAPNVGTAIGAFVYTNGIEMTYTASDSADADSVKTYIRKLGDSDSTLAVARGSGAGSYTIQLGAIGDNTFYYSAKGDTIELRTYWYDEVPNQSAVYIDTLATGAYFLLVRTTIDSVGFPWWRIQWAISTDSGFTGTFDSSYYQHIDDTTTAY